MTRAGGRAAHQLRPVAIEIGAQKGPAGSCIVSYGQTRVLCAASVEDRVPPWLKVGGWVTAEYAMLPGATNERNRRERNGPRGRSTEIQRLIGRSLRASTDLASLAEVTITVDCDVLEADGGTRTASITGGWVALHLALAKLDLLPALTGQVAAVSVGIVGGEVILDLDYSEDARADVDLNVVALADGDFVEVQGTAEGDAFPRSSLDAMLDLAINGCASLAAEQRLAVEA